MHLFKKKKTFYKFYNKNLEDRKVTFCWLVKSIYLRPLTYDSLRLQDITDITNRDSHFCKSDDHPLFVRKPLNQSGPAEAFIK